MVFANRTYLDCLNRYIVLRYYKALLGISERSLVSTEPEPSIHSPGCISNSPSSDPPAGSSTILTSGTSNNEQGTSHTSVIKLIVGSYCGIRYHYESKYQLQKVLQPY